MKIFTGSANKPLSERIARALKISLSPLEIYVFPDGEKRVRVLTKVVDEDVIVVQPTSPPSDANYMELFFIVDALKRSGAKSVLAVVPYLGYQRQDHVFREGEAVSLAVVVKTLEAIGVDKLITVDLHSIKIPEVFTIPVVHVSALPIFAEKIRSLLSSRPSPMSIGRVEAFGPEAQARRGSRSSEAVVRDSSASFHSARNDNRNDAVLVSPDMGGIRRIKIASKLLDNLPCVVIEKQRDLAKGEVRATRIEGEIRRKAFIVDDMISSGGTIATAAKILRRHGAVEIYVFATHPVFSDKASEVLQKAKVEKVFVTDTIYVPNNKQFPKLEILSVAGMIAEAIKQ